MFSVLSVIYFHSNASDLNTYLANQSLEYRKNAQAVVNTLNSDRDVKRINAQLLVEYKKALQNPLTVEKASQMYDDFRIELYSCAATNLACIVSKMDRFTSDLSLVVYRNSTWYKNSIKIVPPEVASTSPPASLYDEYYKSPEKGK